MQRKSTRLIFCAQAKIFYFNERSTFKNKSIFVKKKLFLLGELAVETHSGKQKKFGIPPIQFFIFLQIRFSSVLKNFVIFLLMVQPLK